MRPSCLALLATLLCAACGGGGGSSKPPQDAAADTGEQEAGEDGGSCFPFCSSADAAAPPPGDASGVDAPNCNQLKAAYDALQGPAQACDPRLQAQCAATINGPCCPVTVSAANSSAVDNFDQAVAAYVAACTADCSKIICMPAPSMQCQVISTTQGRCQ